MRVSERTLERRRRDREAQLKYYLKHRFCQVCGKRAWEVHEIVARSQGGKCEEDNMISMDRNCHERAHFRRRPYLYKEELWRIKGLDIEVMQEQVKKD